MPEADVAYPKPRPVNIELIICRTDIAMVCICPAILIQTISFPRYLPAVYLLTAEEMRLFMCLYHDQTTV